MDLPNNSPRNDLGQDNQSNRSILPTSLGSSNKDLESTGDVSRLDLLNMDDGALPIQESGQDASGTNVGRTADNLSREYHTSLKLQLS